MPMPFNHGPFGFGVAVISGIITEAEGYILAVQGCPTPFPITERTGTMDGLWTDFHPNVQGFIQRGREFWSNTRDRRPLVILMLRDAPLPYGKGDIDADIRMLDAYYQSQFRVRANLDDDGIMGVHPFRIFRHALMPSIVGSAATWTSEAAWMKPVLDDLDRADELNWELSGPTFSALGKVFDFFYPSPTAKSWVPMTAGLVWGPVDLAAMLRGASRFCVDYYENRQGFLHLLDLATDFCIRFGKYVAERAALPELDGAMLSAEPGVYHPPGSVNCADDNLILFPDAARCPEVWAAERKFLGAFNGSLMELHSGSLQHYESYFGEQGPTVVEMGRDPVHESIEQMFEALEPYRGRKPLRHGGDVRNVAGMWQGCARMIDSHVDNIEEAHATLDWLRERT